MTPDSLRQILSEDVVAAAPALLGWDLVRADLRARIVEVEAYRHDDPACHAYGRTKMKNMALWAEPGLAYVYFTYGNHWMLNVVAHPPGDAAAVLIRAARPLTGLKTMFERRPKALREEDLLSGPGKLAAAFEVTSTDNLAPLLDPSNGLHLEPGEAATHVLSGHRIGIALGKGHDTPWRFIDEGHLAWASKPWPRFGIRGVPAR